MNIRDITVQHSSSDGHRTAFGANSFLSIGRKGQIVEGVISSVSDRISINFNGVEVSVSGSSVRNATEGEARSFRIMDVSKDHIVLKEVGNNTSSGSKRAMMGTTVSAGSHSFPDYLEEAREVSEAKQQAGQNIAVLTGEDYQGIESEQGALEEYKESALDRAIEHHKEKRQWQQETMETNREFRRESREDLERLQVQGFIDQKSPEEIAAALEAANLPASESNIMRVAAAMQMAEIVPELSADARVYILENQLVPTIENLYHGQYSAAGGKGIDQVEDTVWQQLQNQMEELLESGGFAPDEALMNQAKWLFANDLPVTVESLQSLQMLDEIQVQMTPRKVMEQIILAMQTGAAPEQASLDDTQLVVARAVMRDFANVTEDAVGEAVRLAPDGDITLALLKQAAGQISTDRGTDMQEAVDRSGAADSSAAAAQELRAEFMAQRQLEEIRLRMTLQSVIRMANKGIDIEVTPLKQLVEELRRQESEYYRELVPDVAPDEDQMDLVQETLAKAEDISRAPAQILGGGVRQQNLLTMNVLHRAAVSATVQMQQYQEDYEAVGTQVRGDLGDSIHKAFEYIPELLADIGLEDTQANERAVRILGYNQMTVSRENIFRVKEMDARVNSVIDHMKPSVVMELIHRGENPLDMPLDALDQELREISEGQEISPEERYSRYLWRLEQNHEITGQEREGYIGIYRLLNQIDQSDGAAVGAVLEAGRSMTLGNLLTAVRTMKGNGIDTQVDDSFGGLEELSYSGRSITQQIESGFQGDMPERDASGKQQEFQHQGTGGQDTEAQYYERIVHRTLQSVTPAALQQMSDGDLELLLRDSLEMFQEKLQQTPGNPQVEQQLYEQLAERLRETVEQSQEAVRCLEQMGIPDTIANIQAAEQLFHEGYDVYRESFDRRRRLSDEEQEEYEVALSELSESMEEEQTMSAAYERLENMMERILDCSYAEQDISYEELQGLKRLSQGILLQSQMVRRHSYDIPMKTGDTVTSLNVTLIQGGEDTGRIQIFLEGSELTEVGGAASEKEKEHGRISAELRMSHGEVRGLVLCEERDSFERLSGQREALVHELEEKGFPVKNLSYSMDQRSRVEAVAENPEQRTPTAQLYQLAKLTVRHMIQVLQ